EFKDLKLLRFTGLRQITLRSLVFMTFYTNQTTRERFSALVMTLLQTYFNLASLSFLYQKP
ncbi:MAG: hypothetical protein N2202_10215, partial [Proteobacteria bacterium]|nr:hypothetical protein [Pseudomonadota bacterium]